LFLLPHQLKTIKPSSIPDDNVTNRFMSKKKKITPPEELPKPEKHPEWIPATDPEEPLNVPEVDPDSIPGETPEEEPPFEVPTPGERP
jgi:hypothetical protein